jgi:hypothetical protein
MDFVYYNGLCSYPFEKCSLTECLGIFSQHETAKFTYIVFTAISRGHFAFGPPQSKSGSCAQVESCIESNLYIKLLKLTQFFFSPKLDRLK